MWLLAGVVIGCGLTIAHHEEWCHPNGLLLIRREFYSCNEIRDRAPFFQSAVWTASVCEGKTMSTIPHFGFRMRQHWHELSPPWLSKRLHWIRVNTTSEKRRSTRSNRIRFENNPKAAVSPCPIPSRSLRWSPSSRKRERICANVRSRRTMRTKMVVAAQKLCKYESRKTPIACRLLIKLFTFHEHSAKLEETKQAQKLRIKPNGVNVIGLTIGAKVTTEDLLTKVCSHTAVDEVRMKFMYFSCRFHRMIHLR